MLKQRIITATLLATLVVLAVFELPSIYFSLVIAAVTLLGANEWLNLTKVSSPTKRGLFFRKSYWRDGIYSFMDLFARRCSART